MPLEFAFEWETAHGDFKFGVKNLTESRIVVISAHAAAENLLKYVTSLSSFQNFPPYIKSGMEYLNFGSNFTWFKSRPNSQRETYQEMR